MLAGLYAFIKSLQYFFKDKNKEMDISLEQQRLALQFDEQNALQEERLIPHFREELASLQSEMIRLRADNQANSKLIAELSVNLTKSEGKVQLLEHKVSQLTLDLHTAQAANQQKDQLIAELRTKIPPEQLRYIQ